MTYLPNFLFIRYSFHRFLLKNILRITVEEVFSRVWLVLAVAVVVGGGVWIVYKWRRNSGKGEAGKAVRQDKEQLLDASDTTKMERQAVDAGTANSMYLFGDFSVFDRSGRNISYMFSLAVSNKYSVSFCVIAMPTEFLPNN